VVRIRWTERIQPSAEATDELFAAVIARDRFDPKIWAATTASAQDPAVQKRDFRTSPSPLFASAVVLASAGTAVAAVEAWLAPLSA